MGNKFFAIFGKAVLVVIVLGIIGFSAFYLGSKSNKPVGNQAPVSTQPTAISTPTQTQTENLTPTPTVDETSAIITAVRKGLIAEHGSDASSLNITVANIEEVYASGQASAQGGGGMWYAAKVNGVWNLVWDGNGQIQCSSLTNYPNFPTNMIPECWDDKTQQLIKR